MIEELTRLQDHGPLGISFKDMLKRFGQRGRISLFKDEFHEKLMRLQQATDEFRDLRMQVDHMTSCKKRGGSTRQYSHSAAVSLLRDVRVASSRLHDVLSGHWHCETSDRHFADICLEGNEYQSAFEEGTERVHFEVAWSCHAESSPGTLLSIDTYSDDQTTIKFATLKLYRDLVSTHENHDQCSSAACKADQPALPLPELGSVSDLCRHFRLRPSDADSTSYAGFLHRSKNIKYLFYTDPERKIRKGEVLSL